MQTSKEEFVNTSPSTTKHTRKIPKWGTITDLEVATDARSRRVARRDASKVLSEDAPTAQQYFCALWYVPRSLWNILARNRWEAENYRIWDAINDTAELDCYKVSRSASAFFPPFLSPAITFC